MSFENIQITLVSSDFKRDLLVLQNLKESEAEAFQSSYEQNAEHYQKKHTLQNPSEKRNTI